MTGISIYKQHDKTFSNVSAYVVVKNGERVATIAFKFPKDGASRLWVYIHWLGSPMVRGFAGGYGYDKRTAACASAAKKINVVQPDARDLPGLVAFRDALYADLGPTWEDALRKAGFDVWQAV